MKKIIKKFQKLLLDWIIAPKVKGFLVEMIYGSKKRTRKYWYYQPLGAGLHELEHFKSNAKEPFWLSLDKEIRPAIILDQTTTLKFNEFSGDWMQLGVGTPEGENLDVKIFVNDKLVGAIKNIESDRWHDFRVAMNGNDKAFNLRVEMKGTGRLYLSNPLFKQEKTKAPKNIICIVLDALSPDHFDQQTTPNISTFFKEAAVCDQVYSQGDWTLPAFSSMLTGLYPSRHGVVNPDGHDTALDENINTLSDLLRKAGYRTFGYSSHLRFSPAYGHAKGFERFIFKPTVYDGNHVTAINQTIQHLESHKDESNFVFLHIFDTHPPFRPSGYFKNLSMSMNRREIRKNKYAEAAEEDSVDYIGDERQSKLKEVDLSLKALFSYLQEQSWFQEATVLLTTDHGPVQIQEGKRLLLDPSVLIPLMVKGPMIQNTECSAFIEGNVDLMPSILKVANLDVPKEVDGRLWPFLGGEERGQVFSESLFRTVYESSIRNSMYGYHYKCGFDHITGKIQHENEESIVIFQRKDGREVEKGVGFEQEGLERVRSQFKSRINGENK